MRKATQKEGRRDHPPARRPHGGDTDRQTPREPIEETSPLRRNCASARNSLCATAPLAGLDWRNWWQDCGYIHVKHARRQTWHRVFPRPISGRTCTRVAFLDGALHWLHDRTDKRHKD